MLLFDSACQHPSASFLSHPEDVAGSRNLKNVTNYWNGVVGMSSNYSDKQRDANVYDITAMKHVKNTGWGCRK